MKKPRGYVMTARARSIEETGTRILDAATELFAELPYSRLTLAGVAERAGVTVQTVIRRYGDKEGLIAAAADRVGEQVARQRLSAPAGDLPGIVENLLDHYDEHGLTALRLLAEEETVAPIAAMTASGRALHRRWCAAVFAPWLSGTTGVERSRRLAQYVAVCDVYTWKLLRLDAGLSRRQTALALTELLEPLTRRS
ncbi:TetR/AcrR family transcriptional regulator [Nocardioides coralli]|uniref:TetR/AcrR family transcriptional regulator n=1 Tax=Nocardioides coralli TaxID=2872154 RepID=UPI001CA39F8E|nr:TetR/AcrR family transcriptional regulator [Nocardioides coralli]QZY30282.1 TetR/AcrR family transcriptional regulator [Nocardioides coralli]